jgi:hypothetical protein
MIGALDLAVRADALHTARWQVRLRFLNKIRQSLAGLGIGEDPLAVLASESPSRHSRIVAIIRDQCCSIMHSPGFDLWREAES